MDPAVEKKWQKRWEQSGIFEPDTDKSKKKFLITVPWPYTNNSLHVGHGRTYTTADIIARYKRLAGFNVLFPMAFHQSGTPILAFSDRIRRGDEKTIQLYRTSLSEYEAPEDIDRRIEEFKEPENIASYFSDRVIKDFASLGFSIDWRRRFTSADHFYQNFVEWQFRKLKELGLIKKGQYPILYSIKDQNAAGEDDIVDGDIDKVSIEEYTGVVFRGKNYSLIAASLRPETVFGITNLWISPRGKYVKFKMDDDYFVISEEAYEKLTLQKQGLELSGEVSIENITASKFWTPMDHREISVYPSDFVDPDNGTGVVYSVPGHAVWDYVALKDSNIPADSIKVLEITGNARISVESLVEELGISSLKDSDKLKEATQRLYKAEFYDGKLSGNNGQFSGMKVVEARDAIKQQLFQDKNGFTFYETSRKAQTRADSKVVVAVLGNQWFIDYSVGWWKEASHEVVNSMLFYPEFYRNAMNDALDWLRERPCARRRGIGTKLPYDEEWVIESLSDSTLYPAMYTNVQQLREIHEELGSIPDDLVEYIYAGGSGNTLAAYSKKVRKLAEQAREEKDYWYGVDIRLTAPPHLSNHLAFYIMNHVALLQKRDSPLGIIISGIVLSNGVKISKSKGNAISLLKISSRYSADLYRLFVAVSADISSMLDWNETEIAAVNKKYEAFLEAIDPSKSSAAGKAGQVENWFMSRFNMHLRDYFDKMDGFDIRGAYISVFYEVLNDLKYVESRGGNVNLCVSSIRDRWLEVMTPVIPHTCEEIWEKAGKKGFISNQILNRDEIGEVDQGAILSEKYLQDIINDVREIMKATGITPKKIDILTCHPEVRTTSELLFSNRLKDVDPKLKALIPEFMKNKKNIDLSVQNELQILEGNVDYIRSNFNCQIELSEAPASPGKKNAWPGRPLIHLS